MTSAMSAEDGLLRLWRWLSWPLLLVPLLLGWWIGLAGLGERVEQRRAVDAAAFAVGFSPLRFDFSSKAQLIGAEVQGGQFTPAVPGTTVVEPARVKFDAAGVFFGLRFDGRVLDLGVFRTAVLVADASCPANLRFLLDGLRRDAEWISTPVELPTGAALGWGRGLPATLIELDALGWMPRERPDAPSIALSQLTRLQPALRIYVEAAPECELRLDSLSFSAEGPLDLAVVQTVSGWYGPGPARHAVEASWAQRPQQLVELDVALSGASTLQALTRHAGWVSTILALCSVLASFLRRPAGAVGLLMASLVMLNLAPVDAALGAPQGLIGLAVVFALWETRHEPRWRRPVWAVALPLALALVASLVAGLFAASAFGPAIIEDDGRYLMFALLQQSLLLFVLWPGLAALDAGTRARLLAAGFALMHLPNFELSLLCLLGAWLGLSWYARRGDALSIMLAHALIGLWLGRSDGFGWLWGLETGWRWFL